MNSSTLFDPTGKQEEFLEALFSGKHKVIFYGGAIRGGKTYAALGGLLMLCKIFPRSKWVVCRKDLERIKTTVLPTFNNIVPPQFVKQEPTSHNSWEFKATNGSTIKFFAENIDKDKELKRFRGLEYDGIVFEETDISRKTFYMGIQRCGTWRMKERMEGKNKAPSLVICTSNPQRGWVKNDIYDKHIRGTLNPNWKYIKATVWDNLKYIGQDWIDQQKENLPAEEFSMMVEGDWNVNLNERPFFYTFKKERHTHNIDIDILPEYALWLSFDFNVNPCTCIVGQLLHDRLHIIKEYRVNGGTEELLERIKHYENYSLYITGDRSARSNSTNSRANDLNHIQRIFPSADYKFYPKSNGNHIHSRRICCSVFNSIDDSVIISRNGCPVLCGELQDAETNPQGGLKKDDRTHRNDSVDAFRYLMNAWFNTVEHIYRFKEQIPA